jgi:hypothetical protein
MADALALLESWLGDDSEGTAVIMRHCDLPGVASMLTCWCAEWLIMFAESEGCETAVVADKLRLRAEAYIARQQP